jgi:hypothetical protein
MMKMRRRRDAMISPIRPSGPLLEPPKS